MSYAETLITYTCRPAKLKIASETRSEAITRYLTSPQTLTYTHTDVFPSWVWGSPGGCEMRFKLKDLGNNKKEKPLNLNDTGSCPTPRFASRPRTLTSPECQNPLDRSRIRTPTIMAQSLTSDERPHVRRPPSYYLGPCPPAVISAFWTLATWPRCKCDKPYLGLRF